MRLAASGFLAALLLAPLAAQAAQPPARFAVTLQGTVVDRLTYERTAVDDECTTTRSGEGGRELAIRSLRPTTVEVRRGASGAVYRPMRIGRLRVTTTTLPGSFLELRRCRFLPPERLSGRCDRAVRTVRRLQTGFRRARNAILFRRPATAGPDLLACGLDRPLAGGWVDLVRGRIDEDALLSGRSLRVVARASGTRENPITGDPTLTATQRTAVRWTLVFRRLN
jgi:hypothetical protein